MSFTSFDVAVPEGCFVVEQAVHRTIAKKVNRYFLIIIIASKIEIALFRKALNGIAFGKIVSLLHV